VHKNLGGGTARTAELQLTKGMMSCSAIKAGGRTSKAGGTGHLERWRFSCKVTVRHDGALLSWGWLNTRLLMGNSE